MSRSTLGIGGAVLFLLVIVISIGSSIFLYIAPASADHTTACVVTDKDRTTDREGGSSMRIYTENCGTLVVKDNLMKGFFNSADLYAKIEKGHTYDFDATGPRVPILSIFPMIHGATEVDA